MRLKRTMNSEESYAALNPPAMTDSPNKRIAAKQNPFHLLTDDALFSPIFQFVGANHYRFVAGVNRRFRKLYHDFQNQEYRKQITRPYFERLISTRITSTASIAESRSRAKIFLSDTADHELSYLLRIEKDDRQPIISSHSFRPLKFLLDSVAVRYGNLDMVKCCVKQQPYSMDSTSASYAAYFGQLEILQWLRTMGCEWDKQTSYNAAKSGNLKVLQWARAKGCPWDEYTCEMAASRGHLKVLKWARANHCPWNKFTCEAAAENGHLDVLQWARENRCPWDSLTCSLAAENGHLEILQWARGNGCEWDKFTCLDAASNGHLKVLQWAIENGCEWDYSPNAVDGYHDFLAAHNPQGTDHHRV